MHVIILDHIQQLNTSNFDLSRSLRVICGSVIGVPIYVFLLMFNSNKWPNSAPLDSDSEKLYCPFVSQTHWRNANIKLRPKHTSTLLVNTGVLNYPSSKTTKKNYDNNIINLATRREVSPSAVNI